jgi:HAD superfamily phosphoserine phosphatase-like hydrolase
MHQFADSKMLKPISATKLQALLDDLEKFRPRGRAVAAFDADGTLWNTDLGEAFFHYQIQHRLVPLPSDPWGHYNRMKDEVSHTAAYLWLAQILKGVELERVRRWAEESVAAQPIPVFEEQRAVLKKLRELDVEVYIVTASITWAVEPGARRLGLRDDAVLGIETEVVNGRVTEKPHGVITYREGKAQALLARTGGVAPYFCAGNTEGDKWLLEAATDVRLVMSSAPEGTENFPTEMKMLDLAAARGWHSHRYL